MTAIEPADLTTLSMPWGELTYCRSGKAGATPLILLHPLAMSGGLWDPIKEQFGADDVITVDFRGHGRSIWDGKSYEIDDLAADVLTLADALGLEQVNLLGMSMGGSVASTLAAAAPGRVERLLLCDTTAWYGPDAATRWAQRAAMARETPRKDQLDFQIDRWFSAQFRGSGNALIAHTTDIFLATNSEAHAKACEALGRFDMRGGLKLISANTLAMTGEQDYATPPEMGQALAEGIRGARFDLLYGVRHFSLIESGDARRRVQEHFSRT